MPDDEDRWREYHITPRYLAGSSGIGDPGFAAVPDDWPRHEPDPYDGRLVITSPDHRIHIGWDGDGLDELWRIGAYHGPVSDLAWLVTANHNTPPEVIGALTEALVHDYAAGKDAFLQAPRSWDQATIRPLLDAAWTLAPHRWSPATASRERLDLVSPDRMAGLRVDRSAAPGEDRYVLWASAPGWTGTRITFTAGTPSHLVAATAAAFCSPLPLVRQRHSIHPSVEQAVRLEPIPPARRVPSTPTPLEVRRIAVTAALQRAQRAPGDRNDPRAAAARARSTGLRTSSSTPAASRPATAPVQHQSRRRQ